MRLSRRGIAMLKKLEGRRNQVYVDPAGYATGGWGQKLQEPELQKYPVGSAIPPRVQEDWFMQSIRDAEKAVRQLVSQPLNQNQFDALVSLTFNIGRGRFARSTLRKLVNAGDFEGAFTAFGDWTKSRRRTLPGLVNRRRVEAELFSEPGRTDLVKESKQISLGPDTLDIKLDRPEFEELEEP